MYIKKNILTVNNGIICHQVNCKGKMGAGLAYKIRMKFPDVYEQYMNSNMELGFVQMIKISPVLYVANLFGQNEYGKDKQYTDYDALMKCFLKLNEIGKKLRLQIYIPYKIGCALAGGNWAIVKNMIYDVIENPVICKL